MVCGGRKDCCVLVGFELACMEFGPLALIMWPGRMQAWFGLVII